MTGADATDAAVPGGGSPAGPGCSRSREAGAPLLHVSARELRRCRSASRRVANIIAVLRATGDFRVVSFEAAKLDPPPHAIATGLPVGVATMEKRYEGGVSGRSATIFTSAFDQARGIGTYVAMESFEGSLNALAGTFNFVHAATTSGTDRTHEHFLIVPSSGTGGLASIRGSGGLTIDVDGKHEILVRLRTRLKAPHRDPPREQHERATRVAAWY